jgi:hypothetical protein
MRNVGSEIDLTGWTLEDIERRLPKYGRKGTSCFVFDEAVGTLVVRPGKHHQIQAALQQEIRRMKWRLRFRIVALRLSKFRLDCRCAALRWRLRNHA